MKKIKIAFIGSTNINGWANRAYTEIPFNKENNTTGINLGFKPSAGKSLAIVHMDENTARTCSVGSELSVHEITNLTGFVEFETKMGQKITNTTASKDASLSDTLKRSIGIVTTSGIPDVLLEVAFNKTFESLNSSKTAQKERRKGLRGNGLQQIVAQDATATEITSPLKQ